MTEKVLKQEERISLALRALYKKYGYQPYKMSKFEEYDLYVTNKEKLDWPEKYKGDIRIVTCYREVTTVEPMP